MGTTTLTNDKQLAIFEDYVMEKGEIAFTGKLSLPMGYADNEKLIAALKLGRTATITVEAGGQRVELSAAVNQRSFGLKKGKDGEADTPWTRCTLKILDGDDV